MGGGCSASGFIDPSVGETERLGVGVTQFLVKFFVVASVQSCLGRRLWIAGPVCQAQGNVARSGWLGWQPGPSRQRQKTFGLRKSKADEAGPAWHTHWKKKKEGNVMGQQGIFGPSGQGGRWEGVGPRRGFKPKMRYVLSFQFVYISFSVLNSNFKFWFNLPLKFQLNLNAQTKIPSMMQQYSYILHYFNNLF
jgi:hypothetical protein